MKPPELKSTQIKKHNKFEVQNLRAFAFYNFHLEIQNCRFKND